MSLVVIGGIPYERLWDWGFKEPPKQNLMGAVMDRAKQLDSREATTTWKTRSATSPAGRTSTATNCTKARAAQAAQQDRLRDPRLPARPRRPARVAAARHRPSRPAGLRRHV